MAPMRSLDAAGRQRRRSTSAARARGAGCSASPGPTAASSSSSSRWSSASALIGVVTPVLAGRVVNDITGRTAGRTVVVEIALVIAGLAVVDAALSFAQRWYSARIGEGLIYDMRTAVFDHVQRMPLAFFTRTQTGALVSRLNNDVLGAQQAFTSTLSGLRVQRRQPGAHRGGDVHAVVADHRCSRWSCCRCSCCPARRIGARLQDDHPRVLQPQRLDERDHDRAVQRRRRAAGQAVRPPGRRGRSRSAAGPRGCATSASPRPCTAGRSSSR